MLFRRAIIFSIAIFIAAPVLAAGELSVQESMQKREWQYGQVPVFEVALSLENASSSDVLLEGRVFSEEGLEISTFTDRARIIGGIESKKLYGLDIPQWKAGYYSVVLKVSSPETDQTTIHRVTFSLRPHVQPWWVYGGAGAAALVGVGMITFVLARRRELAHQ